MNKLEKILLTALSTLTIAFTTQAQNTNFTGRVVNNTQQGLEGKKVEVYFNQGTGQQLYIDSTDANGNFNANSTDVKLEDRLPEGYSISQNYPNPFSLDTKINIEVPKQSKIDIQVYNVIPEELKDARIEQELNAGTHTIQLDMKNYASGVYFARVIIDKKYQQVKKMMLMKGYTFEHTPSGIILPKINTTTTVDSVVITGDAIKRSVFTGFPQYNTNNIDLGTFQVDSNYVNLTLNIKKLMEWQQANNQLANALVNLSGQEKTTDANGQVNFTTPSGKNTLTITHPQTYKREAILQLENDSTHTEYILDTLNYSHQLMDFTDEILGKKVIYQNDTIIYKMRGRWTEPPIFYIVADTTTETGRWRALQQIAKIDTVLKPAYTTPRYPEGFLKNYQVEIGLNPPEPNTPGYYVIEWVNVQPPILASTSIHTDTTTGKIINAHTQYKQELTPYEMDRVSIHELGTGLSAAGRSDALSSVWNTTPSFNERNFTESDKKMILYQYTRPPGNKVIDKDNDF